MDGLSARVTVNLGAREATPTGENLNAVTRGVLDVAVGAGGTVIER